MCTGFFFCFLFFYTLVIGILEILSLFMTMTEVKNIITKSLENNLVIIIFSFKYPNLLKLKFQMPIVFDNFIYL